MSESFEKWIATQDDGIPTLRDAYLAGQASNGHDSRTCECCIAAEGKIEKLTRERDHWEKCCHDQWDNHQKDIAAIKAQAGEQEPICYIGYDEFGQMEITGKAYGDPVFTHPTTERRVQAYECPTCGTSSTASKAECPVLPDWKSQTAIWLNELISTEEWDNHVLRDLMGVLNAAPAPTKS